MRVKGPFCITNVKWEDGEMPWHRQDDQVLRKVEGSFPAGWVMYTEEDRLVIKRREPGLPGAPSVLNLSS